MIVMYLYACRTFKGHLAAALEKKVPETIRCPRKTVVAGARSAYANTLIDLLHHRHMPHISLRVAFCMDRAQTSLLPVSGFSIHNFYFICFFWRAPCLAFLEYLQTWTINRLSLKGIILANATNCPQKIILTYGYLTLQVSTICGSRMWQQDVKAGWVQESWSQGWIPSKHQIIFNPTRYDMLLTGLQMCI